MAVKISVAMATYNGEKYIRQQLDTIASQTYLPCELVVCDDGSSDETINIIRDFSLTVPFPVYIFSNEVNLGFSNNFLKCASLCSGEWIAFCDQDDIWLPQKLESIKNVIESSSKDLVLVYHAAELVNESLETLGRRLPVIYKDKFAPVASHSGFWFVGGCVMCFKSFLIKEIDSNLRPRDNFQLNDAWGSGKYPWMPHDKWVCMLANMLGEIAAVARVLSLYRRHGSALTGSHDNTTATIRVNKSSDTGVEAYKFLSFISLETSNSLIKLSDGVSSEVINERLVIGAGRWKDLARGFDLRAKLYDGGSARSKLYLFSLLILNRAYFGNKFSSLGFLSLLKDFAFITGLLPFAKFIFK